MGVRRRAREAALQYLFQEDFRPEDELPVQDLAESFQTFCTIYQINRQARSYALQLLTGYTQNHEQVNALIARATANWRLPRLAATDRNILRLAVYEMLHVVDVPDQVAINEAVEIAKRFGSDESPAFINGVLDAVKIMLRPAQQV